MLLFPTGIGERWSDDVPDVAFNNNDKQKIVKRYYKSGWKGKVRPVR